MPVAYHVRKSNDLVAGVAVTARVNVASRKAFTQGGDMATIWDVANEAGVSIATVSRVMNETKEVSPELKQRVQAAIESTSFRPNRMARTLITKKSQTIGIVVADLSNAVIGEVLKGVNGVCEEVGYSPMVFESGGTREKEKQLLTVLDDVQVDGVLFAGVLVDQELTNLLLDRQYPVVLVTQESSVEGNLLAAVGHDNRAAIREVVQFLVANGHKSIGFIGGPQDDFASGAQRYAGYVDQMEAEGFSIEPAHAAFGDFSFRSGQECMQRVYEESAELPTATIVCSDAMALGALRFLKQSGLRVPQDMSIVGFDDMDFASYSSPELSTVRIPYRNEGEEAAKLLFRMIEGEEVLPETKYLPHKIIRRQSVSRPQ